jgi:hypothetical protein
MRSYTFNSFNLLRSSREIKSRSLPGGTSQDEEGSEKFLRPEQAKSTLINKEKIARIF